jgi:hypothetical protein
LRRKAALIVVRAPEAAREKCSDRKKARKKYALGGLLRCKTALLII